MSTFKPSKTTGSIIYLGLGSNLGDRAVNLRRAISLLPPAIFPERTSRVYETEPLHLTNQPRYYNAVCRATTALAPSAALGYVKSIEVRMGRVDAPLYGARVIDIDILFYDDLQVNLPKLWIPHPRLSERAFVLAPIVEIAPDLVHPAYTTTVTRLLERLPNWRAAAWVAEDVTL